jgi:antitoxin component YwqK of YwqJK toxin-antitoxin module
MKKNLYLLIIFSFLSCICKKEVPVKEIDNPAPIYCNLCSYKHEDFPNEDGLMEGKYEENFKEGGQRYGKIIDGYKEGKWLCGNADFDSLGNVYAKGEIWREEYFKRGLRDSIFRQYGNDGKIIYETTFKRGTGLWKEFHSNGKLYFEIYTKDGYFTDTLRLHDYNGNVVGKRLYLKDSLIYSSGLPCFPYKPESVPSD